MSDVSGVLLSCFSSWMSSDSVSSLSSFPCVCGLGSSSDPPPSGGNDAEKSGSGRSSSNRIKTVGDIRVTLGIWMLAVWADGESHLEGESIGEGGNAAELPKESEPRLVTNFYHLLARVKTISK